MDIKQVAQQILGSLQTPINYGANINATAGNGDVLQHIQNLGALSAQGANSSRALGALGDTASQQASNEEQSAKAAQALKDKAAKEAQDKLDYLNDPKNYKSVINDAGGYDFYDPSGQKLTAVQYAKATNKHITDLYKDSQDPNDKDFSDDHNKVLELGKIIQTGDKKARDKFYEKNPTWKEAYHNSSYNDIVKDLHNEYPGYFTSDTQGVTSDAYGSSDADTFKKVKPKDTRSNKQRVLDLLNPKR